MIRRFFCSILIAGTLAAPCARAQDAAAAIKTAQYALGMIRGPQRIDAVSTLEYWGTGSTYAFGQSYRPGLPWPAFKVTYPASLSYAVPAMRVDVMRSNPDGLVQGGGGLPLAAPQRQIQVVSGQFAWNESIPGGGFAPGTTATPAVGAAGDRLLQLWTTPFGILKAAERAGANAKVGVEGGATVLTFPLSGATTKVTLNGRNQVERVETRADNPVLGDVITATTNSDYKDLGEITSDVLFPSHIVQTQGVFPVPDNVEKAPQTPAPVKVETQKVADGVWYLTGGTHHSVAVEFRNYVALIECPLNDDRAVAVIQAVKKSIPNKLIRYVVNTHHHFDHAVGLRACVAEGATILPAAQ